MMWIIDQIRQINIRRREFSVTYFEKEQCVQCVNSVCVARQWNPTAISIECTVYNPVPPPIDVQILSTLLKFLYNCYS